MEFYCTASWNGETITILTEDEDHARHVACNVWGVDWDAVDVSCWSGDPEMNKDDKYHARKHGWF